MNLKKLYLQQYKNLVDFTANFEAGKGLSILVGNNGSGKSNLLEVISGIFHDLFTWKTKRKIKSDYSLMYDLDGVECKLEQKDGCLRCYGPKYMGVRRFIEHRAPNNVIGLYSGEEDRLWTLFYQEYYEAYVRRIKSHKHQDRMRLIFINKYYWNVALLTLLLSGNEALKPFIENELGIKSVSKVKLVFNFAHFSEVNDLLTAFIDKINPEHVEEQEYTLAEIKERITRVLDRDEFGREVVKHVDVEDRNLFRLLTQACMPKDKKIIKDIIITVNDGITVEQLSEGEKKLILVKTVLEILSDEKTLILMDEPDAHLHEVRKEQLYSIMSGYGNRQIVIASHSPTLIDVAEQERIIMLKPNEKGNVQVYESDKIETIRELTGSRVNVFLDKPILYCEGAETSVEYVLYPLLFPNYKVIPAGGHEEVINLTKTYNRTFGSKRNYAVGIIDWDYKTETQLSELKKDKIYSLKVVEVENVLMDLTLLKAAKEAFCSDEGCIEGVRQALFKYCRERKEYQATKYTANRIVSQIKSGISPDGKEIATFKARIQEVCDPTKIDELYNERLKCLDDYLNGGNFSEIVRICDFNHKIDWLVTSLVTSYQDRILRLIQKREDLKQFLKTEYYSDVK